MTNKERINKALEVAFQYAGYDGSPHKMWVIDQMIRALTGENYNEWIEHWCNPHEEDPETYEWDVGIAP